MTLVSPITSTTFNSAPTAYVNAGQNYVVVGAGLYVDTDGFISATTYSTGTVSSIIVGTGLTGGGAGPTVNINLAAASTSDFGGIVISPTGGINVTGGQISIKQATSSEKGGAFLASSSEVIAGTDANKIVTPATLATKVASTSTAGLVQLSDGVFTTSSVLAATSTAVKTAYDAAQTAQTYAFAALPRTGGTMTGVIVFAAAQSFPGVSLPTATTTSLGVVQIGSGLIISAGGILSTSNNGTVTSITAGAGLGAPATNNIITSSGTIKLLPPNGTSLGGVKAGTNISIGVDGTISATGFLPLVNPYSYTNYLWPVPDTFGFAPGTNGQVLTLTDKTTGTVAWSSAGALNTITAGTGITATTVGSVATIGLTTVSSITPATYGATAIIPTFTVNAQGQLTSSGIANPYPPFQIATVSAPPSLVLDFTTNNTNWEYTLNTNLTIGNPINTQPGMRGGMLLRQDPSTPFALSWGSSWKFAGGTPAAISAVASAVDYFDFVVVTSTYIVVTNYIKALS